MGNNKKEIAENISLFTDFDSVANYISQSKIL